jgi:hypothetical protein
MRLSHKKKLAHKRSGAAKGWAFVLLSRKWRRDGVTIVIKKPCSVVGEIASNHDEASSAASDDYIAMGFTTSEPCVIVGEVASRPVSTALDAVDEIVLGDAIDTQRIDTDVDAAVQVISRSVEHTGSLMNKLVGAVASTFRRLRDAGAAQADIIRGRIG